MIKKAQKSGEDISDKLNDECIITDIENGYSLAAIIVDIIETSIFKVQKESDEVVINDVFGSLPVRELRPRNAVSTKIKVSAIFEDLPAISAAFLYVVDKRSNAVRPRASSITSSDKTLRNDARALETV